MLCFVAVLSVVAFGLPQPALAHRLALANPLERLAAEARVIVRAQLRSSSGPEGEADVLAVYRGPIETGSTLRFALPDDPETATWARSAQETVLLLRRPSDGAGPLALGQHVGDVGIIRPGDRAEVDAYFRALSAGQRREARLQALRSDAGWLWRQASVHYGVDAPLDSAELDPLWTWLTNTEVSVLRREPLLQAVAPRLPLPVLHRIVDHLVRRKLPAERRLREVGLPALAERALGELPDSAGRKAVVTLLEKAQACCPLEATVAAARLGTPASPQGLSTLAEGLKDTDLRRQTLAAKGLHRLAAQSREAHGLLNEALEGGALDDRIRRELGPLPDPPTAIPGWLAPAVAALLGILAFLFSGRRHKKP